MNETIKAIVRSRAGERCEYCHLRQIDSPLALLHVDHVIPKKHGGGHFPSGHSDLNSGLSAHDSIQFETALNSLLPSV